MNIHKAVLLFNSVLTVCTTVLVLGLYYMGFGGYSLFGLLLMLALTEYKSG